MRSLLMDIQRLGEWLEMRTWIVWYMRQGSDGPKPIRIDWHREISFIPDEAARYKSRNYNCDSRSIQGRKIHPDAALTKDHGFDWTLLSAELGDSCRRG
jgi:hypothetical protein